MSAMAGSIAAPWGVGRGGIEAAWVLRSVLSLLAAVAVLAVALPAAFGSGARGAGVDPIQVFSFGPLLSVDSSGQARLSATHMVPGQSRTATIRLSNGGSAPASLSFRADVVDRVRPGGMPLSSALVLRIDSAGPRPVELYDGPIGAAPSLRLGTLAAGTERAYRVTVSLPAATGNAVAGSRLSAGLAWNAT
jgi:hypothetical protein